MQFSTFPLSPSSFIWKSLPAWGYNDVLIACHSRLSKSDSFHQKPYIKFPNFRRWRQLQIRENSFSWMKYGKLYSRYDKNTSGSWKRGVNMVCIYITCHSTLRVFIANELNRWRTEWMNEITEYVQRFFAFEVLLDMYVKEYTTKISKYRDF